MNIWYINHYGGGPGIARGHRPYNLVRVWNSLGHDATVICASFHHLLEKPTHFPKLTHIENVPYLALPARKYEGNGIGRILNMLDFTRALGSLHKTMPKPLTKPDVVVATSPHPFVIYPARKLAQKFNVKLVFEIRDIWPLSITEINGTSPLHPFVQLCAHAERYAYAHADLITSPLPRAGEHVARISKSNKPFVWIPNGIPNRCPPTGHKQTNPLPPTTRKALEQMQAWHDEARAIIIHPGSMGPPNGLEILLDAVAVAKSENAQDKFGVILIGEGTLKNALKQRAAEQGLSNIKFFDAVPKSDIETILAKADIGYAGLKNIPNLYRYGIALNKVFDFTKAGLPVVLPIAPCGDPVSESSCGIARQVETPADLWHALRELIDMPRNERMVMGAKGREYTRSAYDFDMSAKRYLTAMQSCMDAPRNNGT